MKELVTNIPTEFHKDVVVCGYLHQDALTSLAKRVARQRAHCVNPFYFLEWAEAFLTDYNKMQKLADVRLMSAEELSEFMPVNGHTPRIF